MRRDIKVSCESDVKSGILVSSLEKICLGSENKPYNLVRNDFIFNFVTCTN